MFEGKAPLRLAVQKSRLHAQSVPMRSAPAYFLCKWVVWHIHLFFGFGQMLMGRRDAPQRSQSEARNFFLA
jgi:hypothetical protein